MALYEKKKSSLSVPPPLPTKKHQLGKDLVVLLKVLVRGSGLNGTRRSGNTRTLDSLKANISLRYCRRQDFPFEEAAAIVVGCRVKSGTVCAPFRMRERLRV